MPLTELPIRNQFFDDIVRVKDDGLNYDILNSQVFGEYTQALYGSGIMWRYDGGTNFWSDADYKLSIQTGDSYLTAW